jgi:hypothetical protein
MAPDGRFAQFVIAELLLHPLHRIRGHIAEFGGVIVLLDFAERRG